METIKPKNFFTNINTKLNEVAGKIEAENERKVKEMKALNVIVVNNLEWRNSTTLTSLENSKNDMQTIQSVLGESKIKKQQLKSLCRVDKTTNVKNKPIIIKLNDVASEHRLLKLRNLKVMHNEIETNVYTNPDRTVIELESFRILRN